MKLLIITQAVNTEDPVLGFFVRWIEEFAKHAESVEVICLREGSHASLPGNVRVHSLGKEHGAPRFAPQGHFLFFNSLRSQKNNVARRVRYAVRFLALAWRLRRDYDAVFVHMNPEYLVLAGWLWRLSGKRSVLWYTHKSVDLKLRVAVFFANAVCTASRESFRLASAKVQVVGHGIDERSRSASRAKRAGALRILTIGRLSPTKRIVEMLHALDVLASRGQEFSFTIAGVPATQLDEQYEKDVRAALLVKPYAARVHFLGAVSHKAIPGLLADADVFLNLSSTGSMDKAVLEALAAGVPAVTTNEAFRDLLAPSGLFIMADTPEVIADALVQAAERDITPLAHEVRERYSLTRLIKVIVGIIAAL